MKVKNTTRRHRLAAGKLKRSVSWLQSRRRPAEIAVTRREDPDAADRPR